ncbi:hypothetical protein BO83DRAFT_50825 [Aspergillus eucalypticola CBS 122712]|uniref:Uncharacterized protein n=1 Tax=Aspergillus eucalypticola (strain CBS 122712 / IBT 29274) TaxID=1448314 RepID=A0A317VB67_ASPEC|nr:uncharacterized protein BO83DRAFT_50825 [Aspergillus eucalypticola CBS 122712]PWY71275.1 hypothetical protein BO83DRAFT_50825 [Aspergillus eucalypticola CBS 122712]
MHCSSPFRGLPTQTFPSTRIHLFAYLSGCFAERLLRTCLFDMSCEIALTICQCLFRTLFVSIGSDASLSLFAGVVFCLYHLVSLILMTASTSRVISQYYFLNQSGSHL